MPAKPARELWQTALGTLQLEVSRHNYDTWFKDTIGLGVSDSCLTVGVPSEFVAQCLEKRMGPVVLKTLRALAQEDLAVRYQVHQPKAAVPTSLPSPEEHRLASHYRNRSQASTRSTPLNPAYTFDTFIVGKSNRFAHAAAMAVADKPGRPDYNPLYLFSGVGLGKTHLLHAIGHSASAKNLHCIYVSAEQFTNDFVTALRDNRAEDFRDKYRSADILLVDDIQFIAGKEHSKESFFHTFNDLHGAHKQIVITSDSRPKAMPLVEERLQSRFEGGLVADIQLPELETRLAILEAKALQAGITLPREIGDFIARRVTHNVRELEGVLNRLVVMSRISGRSVDMELAQQALADIPSVPKRNSHSPASIVTAVASYYRVSAEELSGPHRSKEIARARQVAAYLIREETSFSLADAGKFLGNRGHTTILRAHEKIARQITVDSGLREDVSDIREHLQGPPSSALA